MLSLLVNWTGLQKEFSLNIKNYAKPVNEENKEEMVLVSAYSECFGMKI